MQNDFIGYRDYLRAIFTGKQSSEGYARYKQQLEKRFHQNFETLNITQKPGNQILIPILKGILSASIGNDYGLGINAADIQPQQVEKSDREYLDYLIGLTQLSATELSLRYRLDLKRPDTMLSSEVQENIATLQGFYRDSFQCEQEPSPIIPAKLQGRAPFFLYYEEWLQATKPFYAENFYHPKQPFLNNITDEDRRYATSQSEEPGSLSILFKWFLKLVELQDKIASAHQAFNQGQYGIAHASYQTAGLLAEEVLALGVPEKKGWTGERNESITVDEILNIHKSKLSEVKNLPMTNIEDLMVLQTRIGDTVAHNDPQTSNSEFAEWLAAGLDKLHFCLLCLSVYQIPLCLGDVALTQGNYAEAVSIYANFVRAPYALAVEKWFMGYSNGTHYYDEKGKYYHGDSGLGIHDTDNVKETSMFLRGYLPYSLSRSPLDVDINRLNAPNDRYIYPQNTWIEEHGGGTESLARSFSWEIIPKYTHPMQEKFFRLRQGNAMLEWADALYRTDEPANIGRARELYKAVLFLRGEMPPIAPTWTTSPAPSPGDADSENPALTSQEARARRGFYQIEAGLNYYGYSEAMVPLLRYRTLKEAADRFASSAKSAQQDFLLYTANVEKLLEEALRERLTTANALRKAALLGQIAREQAEIAQHGVEQAEQQVEAVKAAIEAKIQEIDDHDGFFSQVKDFAEGFSDAVGKKIPSKLADSALSDVKDWDSLMALSGESVMVGYGVFLYGSYTSMSGMTDAQNRRRGELNALQEKALPAAQTLVKIKQGEVHIARLQQQLAQADAEFAQQLAAAIRSFQDNRSLSVELWSNLAAVMKRVMRRYLELGARYAWLAERALAYEQDRSLRIVRFDYFPMQFQGVTGADLLQLDLAELEAARLDNIKQTAPIKRTFSLSFDFPLEFAQLEKTGQCVPSELKNYPSNGLTPVLMAIVFEQLA